jgi:hypothetical protein
VRRTDASHLAGASWVGIAQDKIAIRRFCVEQREEGLDSVRIGQEGGGIGWLYRWTSRPWRAIIVY